MRTTQSGSAPAECLLCVRTDRGAADDAVVDRRGAVLRHLQRVVLVVRHRRVRLRRELQVQPWETDRSANREKRLHYKYNPDKWLHYKYSREKRLHYKYNREKRLHYKYNPDKWLHYKYNPDKWLHYKYNQEKRLHYKYNWQKQLHYKYNREKQLHYKYNREKRLQYKYNLLNHKNNLVSMIAIRSTSCNGYVLRKIDSPCPPSPPLQ